MKRKDIILGSAAASFVTAGAFATFSLNAMTEVFSIIAFCLFVYWVLGDHDDEV